MATTIAVLELRGEDPIAVAGGCVGCKLAVHAYVGLWDTAVAQRARNRVGIRMSGLD